MECCNSTIFPVPIGAQNVDVLVSARDNQRVSSPQSPRPDSENFPSQSTIPASAKDLSAPDNALFAAVSNETSHTAQEENLPQEKEAKEAVEVVHNAQQNESATELDAAVLFTTPETRVDGSDIGRSEIDGSDEAALATPPVVIQKTQDIVAVAPRRAKSRWTFVAVPLVLGVGLTALYSNSRRSSTVVTTKTTTQSTTQPFAASSTPGANSSAGAKPFVLPGFSNQLSPSDSMASTSDPKKAQNAVNKPSKTAPLTSSERTRIQAEFQAAVAAQRTGRTAEALAAYRRVLALKSDIPEARINLALLLLKEKRLEEALVELRRARKLDRRNPAVAMQMAQTLLSLKRPREAVEPLKSVVALAPQNPQGWATLAQTQTSLNRPAEAISAWKRVAALLPKDVRAPLALASLEGRGKNLAQAEKWARRALSASEKTDPRATLLLGRVLAARGKSREAETLLRDGLQRFPDALEMGTILSDIRWTRGDKKGAIATLQSLLPRVPARLDKGIPRAQLYAQIGRALAQTGRHREAADALANASSLVPQNAALRALWSEALLRSGNREGGIEQLRRALNLDPKRVELHWPLARALAASKEWKLADIEYSKARRIRKIAPEMLVEQAQVQERLKKIPQAIATWKELSQLLPRSPLPLLQSGRLLRATGRDREALNVYTRVLQTLPKEPNALLGAARLEEKIGDKARALSQWTRLAQTRPDFSLAYGRAMFLAVTQKRAVDTANALKAPLRKQVENRAAFAAILRGLIDAGETEAAQSYIKDFRTRFPKANAPQWAQTALEVELKKRQLAAAQQGIRTTRDGGKTEGKPRPTTTRPAPSRPSLSRTSPRATPPRSHNSSPTASATEQPSLETSPEKVAPAKTSSTPAPDLTFTPPPLSAAPSPRPKWTPQPLSAPMPSNLSASLDNISSLSLPDAAASTVETPAKEQTATESSGVPL